MFRRHLVTVVTFPLAVVALVLLSIPLASALKSHTVIMIFQALYALAVIGCVLTVQTLALYRRTEPRRKVEWLVLAPLLVASAFIAGHWTQFFIQFFSIPFSTDTTVRWLEAVAIGIFFLMGTCLLLAALGTYWMTRKADTGSSRGLLHEVAAMGLLTAVVLLCSAGARDLAWRIYPDPGPNMDAILKRSAVSHGGALIGFVAAGAFLAILFGRGADQPSRWRLLALWSVWVCLDSWMRDLHWVLPRVDPYEWTWVLGIGLLSGTIAILYAHLVVGSLWRRAFEPTGQASSPLESGLPL
ncbi:MAG TPA: hypothetical protein VMW52_07305 [Phycisphaerae bacterium]|nr:hypothetical protein [Phycisphaerae bacterium]